MKNFIRDAKQLRVVAPATLTSGQPFVIGNLFLIAEHAAASGAMVNAYREGVFELPKLAADANAVGEKLNFNSATGELQEATSTLDNVATVIETAGAATTKVKCVLTPR